MLMRNLRVVDTSQAKFFALLKISELSLLWLTDHRVVVLLVHGQTKKKEKKLNLRGIALLKGRAFVKQLTV